MHAGIPPPPGPGRQPPRLGRYHPGTRQALDILSFIFYHPQRSWGKVIFSQASVILFTGGSASLHAGIPQPPSPDQAGTPLPRTEHTGRYGQRVGGKHPSEMSLKIVFEVSVKTSNFWASGLICMFENYSVTSRLKPTLWEMYSLQFDMDLENKISK